MNEKRISTWYLNGIYREKSRYKLALYIQNTFNANLPYLDCNSYECAVKTNDVTALRFVDKDTLLLTLYEELRGKSECLPVLDTVEDLMIKYCVTQDQANMLASVFPQYTVDELIGLGE